MNLDIKKSFWGEMAAKWLSGACTPDYTLDQLAADVNCGDCVLFNVYDQDEHVASMVLRLDDLTAHKEMVVVAGGGKWTGGSLYKILTPFCEKLAKNNNAKFLRGHCSKQGIGRLMTGAGWELSEYVYRKEVA